MLKGILNLLLAVFICSASWAQTPAIQVISQYTCVGGTNSYRASGGTVSSWTINGPYSNLTMSSDKTRINFTWSGTKTGASVSVTTSNGTVSTPTFNVTAPIVPSVSISPANVSIVSGSSVTFTATPVNGGTSPYYAWYINGVSSAVNVNSFSTAALQNGDKVYATMLSNAACPPNVNVTSNTVTAAVTYSISPPVVQSYSIPFNTSKLLDATGAGTNEVYRWYDAQSGGTLLGQGVQYQTAVLTDNKTYYVSKYNTSNLSESPRVAQTVTVIVPDPDVPILSTNTCGDKILTRSTPPSGIIWYWQGTNSTGTSIASSVSSYTIPDAKNKTYYIRAKSATGSIWSNAVGVPVTTDPSDLVVTNYQSQNPVIQATYSITLKPGFAVTGGNQFTARIAITSECNDTYNWDEQIAYDQNGQPIFREREYTSGLGNLLQSQQFDYATGKIFSSQPLYDSYNTVAGMTLPAPLPANDFLFKRKWLTNSSGAAYSAADFDVNINAPTPVGSDIGSVGWYYSSANTLEPLTPTTNYPYSRTYSPPGPDTKSIRHGEPGDQYRLGASHEVRADKQKIAIGELTHYYTVRGLLNLPGGNPGASASVGYKYISTDPDGKQVIEFTDADGRSLASAIITSTGTYDHWSYTFYNDLGQVVATIDPKGIDTSNTTTLPAFITYYKYDNLRRLIETTSPDQGVSQFVYSLDGKLRFSQNAEQRAQNKFSYTNYDFLGRLVESGEYISNGTSPYVFEPHTTATPTPKSILKIVDNNIPLGQTAQSVTAQNYTGVSKALDATRCSDHTYIVYDGQPGDLPTGDAAHAKMNNIMGRVSRTKNALATTWYSYNEFGNLEWTKQQITGLTGYQIIDYTYDYFGNVTQIAYNKGTSGQFYHYYEYDADQRLSKVYTSKDGSTRNLEATYYYYLHGPLKRVELGNKLQGIDYVYNIDGSLKMINHPDPALDPGADGMSGANAGFIKDIFGEALDYNVDDYTGAGYDDKNLQLDSSYPDQFGGLVKAIRWHSPVDNHVPRAYAFKYDNLNQMDNADFGDISAGTGSYIFSPSGVQAYKEDIGSYDKNGNINSLVRNGKTGNALGNYQYNYQGNTNKLNSVTNNGSAFLSYQYNTIGQMTQQTEGSNTLSIDYTVYGLVKAIRKGANKLVTYEYDDRGDRAIKTVYNPVATGNPVIKKTFYIHDAGGNIVTIYEQPAGGTVAQLEVPIYGAGRIATYKPASKTTFYELSDHQGNVRGVIGNPSPLSYTATLEDNGAADITNPRVREMMSFKNISATAVADSRMNHTPDTVVSNPQYTAYLKWISGMSGQDAKDKSVGPAIALKVEPGDQMDIEAWVKYRKKTSYTRSGITAAMASILGSSYTGTASGLDVLANATQTFQNGLVAATGAHGNGNDAGSLPYAYVYYLLYDRSFNFTTAGWKRVTTEGGFDTGSESLATHGHLSIPGLTFTEPGYIYIFVSNESENTEVWFDDLHVDHKRSTIVAGADYYPFGLPMENREITREDYRYGYQGQYSEEEKETCWNSFELRMYDARIGRWLTVDPYGQFASPYVAMGNVPYSGADFDGGYFSMFGWKGAVIGAVAGVGISFAVGDQDHWYLYALGSATAGSFLASDFAKVKVWGTHRGLGNADALYGGGRENIARINHMDLKYNGKLFTGENLGKITPIVVKAAIQVQSVINQEDTKPTIDPTRSFPPSTEGVSLVDGDVKTGVGEGTPSPPKIASGTDVLQDIADYLRRSGKKVEVTNVNTRFIFKKVGMNGDKQTVLFSMRPHMYKRLLFIHNTLINMGAPEGSVITTRTKFNYWKNNSGVGFRFVD